VEAGGEQGGEEEEEDDDDVTQGCMDVLRRLEADTYVGVTLCKNAKPAKCAKM